MILALGAAGRCDAATYTLSDGSSQVSFDSGSGNLFSWSVDSQNQLNVQNFWYRLNGGNNVALSTLGTPVVSYSVATPNQLSVTYAGPQVSVGVSYTLRGTSAGNGKANIDQIVSIQNVSGSLQNFNLFQFSDYNLMNTVGGDSAVMYANFGGKLIGVDQYKGSTHFTVNSTTLTPPADIGEIDTTSLGGVLRVAGTGSDLTSATTTATGADVSWALEWIYGNMTPGQQDLVSLNNSITGVQPVPEPSVFALLMGGALACRLFRKRAG